MGVMEIFCDEVLMVRINYCEKLDNLDVWPLSVENKAQFCLILISIFLKACVKGHRDSSSRFLERRIFQIFLIAT